MTTNIYTAGYLIKQPRLKTNKEGVDVVRSRMLVVDNETNESEIVYLTASGDVADLLYEYNIGKYLRVAGTGFSTGWHSSAHGDLMTALKLNVHELEDPANDDL